ncbi:MAG: hypothetical protein QM739_06200 [Propionivibrio sp.]
MLPSTVDRVPRNTAIEINARILQHTRQRVARTLCGGSRQIVCRLAELDREWDIERVLEANAASVSLLGFALGFRRDRRYLLLPVIVSAFLLQHALQGWCPPLPLLRRLGVRTANEIEQERQMLLQAVREALPAPDAEGVAEVSPDTLAAP